MIRGLDNWVTVPTNSTITIHKQTVMIHPIVDKYYNRNPSYVRNSKFAKDKGLVTNVPGDREGLTPATIGGHTPVEDGLLEPKELEIVKHKLEEVQRVAGSHK